MKALELAKTQPYAFTLPRADAESRIPRTDDADAPAAALVSTNFSTAAEAIAFLDAVCGPTLRFNGSNELLTFDTPRKRSVLVTTKPTPLSIPDRTDAFRAFAPTLIGAFGGETSAFAVSELVCGDGASSAFLLVDNSPFILHTASEHSSFVRNLVASLGDAASAYVLASPTEALGDVPYASVPVCLNSFSGVRKMFNLIVSAGQDGVRKLLTICKDPAGHLLTAGPRPSTGPELTISTRLSYGREPVSTIADVRDAMRWRRGLEMLRVQLGSTVRITPESVMHSPESCCARCRTCSERATRLERAVQRSQLLEAMREV